MEDGSMTRNDVIQPRCSACDHVLPSPGAICHVCDVEGHFEGAIRTAPPIINHMTGSHEERATA